MKNKIIALLFLGGTAAFTFSAIGTGNADSAKGFVAIDTMNFDRSVRPQDDFFQFVNGNWVKNNPIPASENSWGNFSVLNEKSRKALREICEETSKAKNPAGSNAQKIGDMYASGLDSVAINKAGFAPLKPTLDLIENTKDLTAIFATLHKMQVPVGFGVFAMADMKDSKTNILYIGQSGTCLPDKDYYFSKDNQTIREGYKKHIENIFSLLGNTPVNSAAKRRAAYELEEELARVSMNAVERRDPVKQYNRMSIAELQKISPNIKWTEYFKAIGASQVKDVIVTQPAFITNCSELMKPEYLENWKSYLTWQLVHAYAGQLHDAVANENFNFFDKELNGLKSMQPRWKRVLGMTNATLGEAVSQIYVERNFSPEAKKRVNEMVDNLTAAYKDRIKTRKWMSDSTKMAANIKLEAIIRKLGFPDKWRDYSGLTVSRKSYLTNILNSAKFDFAFNIARLSKPVDRMEWQMLPSTVNAYYEPSVNEIVFPAAIMQTPFFDVNADDAVNYGAMGAVIGHELTHGFDDQGAQFDATGNMVNWWTDADLNNFKKLTQKLVFQFNQYVAVDTLHVNGELTLGENIADLGGLTISYYAWKKSLEGKPAPAKIDGFTGEQRFFISWAQAWRNSMRDAGLRRMVKTNPHSPARFRVLGPLSNSSEFYQAFGVKEGDKMYRKPEDRVEIW